LDAALRVATRIEIAKLKESLPESTMIYVTHDQVEAMTLADRIVVLSAGYIEQVGAPIELYEKPANLFVAQFIGSPAMNIVEGTVTKAGKTTSVELATGGKISLPIATEAGKKGEAVHVGFRPEDMGLANGKDKLVEGEITLVESLGEVTNLYVQITGAEAPVVAKIPGTTEYKRGQTVKLNSPVENMHLFGADGKTLMQ